MLKIVAFTLVEWAEKKYDFWRTRKQIQNLPSTIDCPESELV